MIIAIYQDGTQKQITCGLTRMEAKRIVRIVFGKIVS